MKSINNKGQALVEYIFVLLFAIMLGIKTIGLFSDFFRDSLGNLSHVLTLNLTIGICEQDCFYSGYKNGPK